jgi:hypothetical protein
MSGRFNCVHFTYAKFNLLHFIYTTSTTLILRTNNFNYPFLYLRHFFYTISHILHQTKLHTWILYLAYFPCVPSIMSYIEHTVLEIHFNIILLFTPRHAKWSTSLKFLHENFDCMPNSPSTYYKSRPSNHPWYDHARGQIMKLFIMKFFKPRVTSSSSSARFLKRSMPVLFFQSERPSLTSITKVYVMK